MNWCKVALQLGLLCTPPISRGSLPWLSSRPRAFLLARRGGEFFPPPQTQRVGGLVNTRIDAKDLDCKPAARFAPGTLGRDQPLQPLGLPEYHRKGPLAEPLGEGLQAAVDAYLDFLENQEYSSDNFGAAAKLGTQVLKEGKGWKEANRALRRCSLERHGNHFEELHGNFFEGSFGKMPGRGGLSLRKTKGLTYLQVWCRYPWHGSRRCCQTGRCPLKVASYGTLRW